jgi:molecular chaperone GrpE
MNSKKSMVVPIEGRDGQAMEPNSPTAEPDSTDPAALQNKLTVQKDAYLRLAADFENFQKRTRRDSEREAAAEKESFIREMLPVLDNLERALASEDAASSGPLYQGVEMVWQQWIEILHRHGIDAVDDLGRPFDPYRHEAVSVRHDPSQDHHIVLEVLQRGYRRGDQLFRPAKVIVNDLRHTPGGQHAG